MKFFSECGLAKKEAGRGIKWFGFLKQDRGRDRREVLADPSACLWEMHFRECQTLEKPLLTGTTWGGNTFRVAPYWVVLKGLVTWMSWKAWEVGSVSSCLASGRLANTSSAHSVTGIVGIPGISHCRMGLCLESLPFGRHSLAVPSNVQGERKVHSWWCLVQHIS